MYYSNNGKFGIVVDSDLKLYNKKKIRVYIEKEE